MFLESGFNDSKMWTDSQCSEWRLPILVSVPWFQPLLVGVFLGGRCIGSPASQNSSVM